MARLRRSRSYTPFERPYTRISKFRKKSFIRITPNIKITRFDMGGKGPFEYELELKPKIQLQIRQEALEAARQTSLRMLEKNIAKDGFRFVVKVYPFHILRENPIAAGAGADRMSTGMAKPFGKPMGVAARIRKGQTVFSVSVGKANRDVAMKALKRASKKLPCSCLITETKLAA